jgi:hypothetical protein
MTSISQTALSTRFAHDAQSEPKRDETLGVCSDTKGFARSGRHPKPAQIAVKGMIVCPIRMARYEPDTVASIRTARRPRTAVTRMMQPDTET